MDKATTSETNFPQMSGIFEKGDFISKVGSIGALHGESIFPYVESIQACKVRRLGLPNQLTCSLL